MPVNFVCFKFLMKNIFLFNMENSVFFASLTTSAKFIGAGLATIGVAGAGMGIGVVFSGYMNAAARNEMIRAELFRYAILGFALTEAMGLLAIMIAFLILYG
jgi:F-type H+-transporting ATPase subunit c